MSQQFITIDPALGATGYTVWGVVKTGKHALLESGEIKSKTKGFDRYWDLPQKMIEIAQKHKCSMAVIEDYAVSKFDPIPMISIGHSYRLYLQLHDIPWTVIHPSTLKIFATGSGKGDKAMIMKEVYKRWYFEGTNNECDAYTMGKFVLCALGAVEGMPQTHTRSIDKWVKDGPERWKLISKWGEMLL